MDHHRDEEMTDKIFANREEDWQDICESRARKRFVQKALEQIDGVYNINNLGLIMATDPCFSKELTIYTSLMIPALRSMKNLDKCTGKTPKTWQKNVHVEHSSLKTKKIHSKSS